MVPAAKAGIAQQTVIALTTSATVLVYYIYQKAFIDWDLGYSSSVAMVLFLMVLFVTIIQFRGQAKREKA